MRKMTEDFIGVCQWCLGEYKVTNKHEITLHGYQRPGHGFVIGRCNGVGHQPFEYAKDLTEEHLSLMVRDSDKLAAKIARIDAGEVKRVPNSEFRPEGKRDKYYNETTPEYLVPGDRLFDYRLKVIHTNLMNAKRWIDETIDYYRNMCANWSQGKIVGIDVPATGKMKVLRDAYSAEDANRQKQTTDAKAARDAKPGKLMINVYSHIPYPDQTDDEDKWREGITAMYAAEKKFRDTVKIIAKPRFPGKIWVGDGDRSEVERMERKTGFKTERRSRIEAVAIKPEWHYLDDVLAKYPDAHKVMSPNGKEVRLWMSIDEFAKG